MSLINKPTIQVNNGLKIIYSKTIKNNPYIPLTPYTKQQIPIIEAIKPEVNKQVNSILVGAGGYGGKTILGSMLAAQYLLEEDYTCLVTRRNYAELLDTNSIWENLSDWCTDTTRLKDNQICEVIKSPTPRIIAPNGNTIYFKAFDRTDKKGKFKSASYDRIINDEASELPDGILQFQYRSMRNTSWIPRSIINLSNPGGESTDYLVEHYVDGPNPYVALDWRDNPYIDREAYKQSLLELDYVDQQYQMEGNWHYRASAGDLINLDELTESYISDTYLTEHKIPVHISAIAVDLAGTGRDRFVATHLILLSNGLIIREDSVSITDNYPEDILYDFVESKCKQYNTQYLDFEREPGSDSLYSKRYWKEIMQPLTNTYGLIVSDVRPFGSKYNRARPVAKAIKDGRLKLMRRLDTDTMKDGLFDQFIYVSPNLDEMKKLKSPDELDSFGYAFNRVDMFAGGVGGLVG